METTEGKFTCNAGIAIPSSSFAWEKRLRSHAGFDGRFKSRFEDFHVHEIDVNGQILHLTELYPKEVLVAELSLLNEQLSGAALNDSTPSPFLAEEEAIRADGSLTESDIQALLEFLLKLSAKRANSANATTQVSESTTPVEYRVSNNVTSTNSAEMPLYCILIGNFLREWRKHTEFSDTEKHASTESKVCLLWKNVRTGVHRTIQRHFPFLSTESILWETVEKSMIDAYAVSSSRNSDEDVTKVPFFVLELRKYLEKISQEVGESASLNVLKYLQVVKVFPKPQCLFAFASTEKQKRRAKKNLRKQNNLEKNNIEHENNLANVAAVPSGEIKSLPACLWKSPPNNERWPKGRGCWLYFRIYKENRNTAAVISMLARCLNRRVKDFSFAGTKDKRAITIQAICAYKVTPEQMKRAMLHPLWDSNVKVSTFSFEPERLQLGHLQGNHFCVALRGVPCESLSLVDTAFNELKERGFVNYFGSQRFGTFEIKTFEIGAAILCKKWETAVRLILGDTSQRSSSFLPCNPFSSNSESSSGRNARHYNCPTQSSSVRTVEETVDTLENSHSSPLASLVTVGMDTWDSSSLEGIRSSASNPENPSVLNTSYDLPLSSPSSDSQFSTSSAPQSVAPSPVSQDHSCVPSTTPRYETQEEMHGQSDSTSISLQERRFQACALYLEKGDAAKALKSLPWPYHLERTLLIGLHTGLNFKDSLLCLPLNSLTLYIHAVQSLIFNFVASYRIQKFGLHPVKGDFVVCTRQNSTLSLVQESFPVESMDSNETNNEEERLLQEESNGKNISLSSERTKRSRASLQERQSIFATENECGFLLDSAWNATGIHPIRMLTSEKECSNYSLFDVVLPIPGDRIAYPEHLKQVYEEAAQKFFQISLSAIKSPFSDPSRIGSVTGRYRSLIVKPQDVSWTCTSDPSSSTECLLSSDVHCLMANGLHEKGEHGAPVVFSSERGTRDLCEKDIPKMTVVPTPKESLLHEQLQTLSSKKCGESQSDTMAVLFSCSLPKSAYLSMAIRELLTEKSFKFV
ncbi:hypothetical protein IE077_000325 [Cardiosporidium cionae]|uniref:TRUD domain-containing protein n=1 Tax=Cardiosporidium cionae TaxID=476202 RepID=A0ABQ7J4E4_9APIC|nr:hypothetical protein IE077_000325 [Cardiosporidium cionae]|eukprot:KAF8818022.1 hypothetical protein IE077_000325 [Cardiosporidium cionae]